MLRDIPEVIANATAPVLRRGKWRRFTRTSAAGFGAAICSVSMILSLHAAVGNPLTVASEERATASKMHAGGIAWFQGDVAAAFALATQEHKPVLLFWSAVWCPYCQALKSSVFTRSDFIEKSRLFIPVYLDGDRPGAQKWGETLKVSGYPTVVILRADRTEIARLSGGMDLTQYAGLLDDALTSERPVGQLLAAATDPSTSAASMTRDDCRRLAFNQWETSADSPTESLILARELTAAAARCPVAARRDRTRLTLSALSFAVTAEESALRRGRPASPALQRRVRQVGELLIDSDLAIQVVDLLRDFDSPFFSVVRGLGKQFSNEFSIRWFALMNAAATDSRFGTAEQLDALASAILASRELQPERAIAPETAQAARKRVQLALAEVADRGDVVHAALGVLDALGDDAAAHTLLEGEIRHSDTPYYYMSELAGLDEKHGRRDQAIHWLEAAYAASSGPATRVQWGDSYVRGLLRMTPDELSRIRSVGLQVVGDNRSGPYGRSRARLDRMIAAMRLWASTPERRAVLRTVLAAKARSALRSDTATG